MFRGVVLMVSVLLAAPCWSAAKCPVQTIQLRGVVLAGSGQPVAGARVNISWSGSPEGRTLVTGSDGRYETTVKFSSYSGTDLFGMLCLETLDSITVSAATTDGRSAKKILKPEQLPGDVRLVMSFDAGQHRPGSRMPQRARWAKW